ncbi:AraC family transcriptional regulator [Sporocytophaga myxococcoides]|uniref:AraC family transcriptional regulator n=1 Tax=Sporocytophaga myxococcoides TaxID=153721 RepID=A0A098L920_9BACT|nr:AraC family transcriptional regulator [Sporocytophaga myxococcoides]GAL83366.1 AraC family transcriptional regulator [Sporocytophaga myxococcoides]
MHSSGKNNIPVYSIDRFKRSGHYTYFQIEIFDKNRDFKVQYPHRHDFYEILFITKGSGKHTIDFFEYEIKPGSIFFLSPGQIHDLDLSEDISGYIFLFTSEFYLINKNDQNKLLELPFFYPLIPGSPPLYINTIEEVKTFSDIFIQAIAEREKNFEDSPDLIGALLDILLIHCKRLYPQNAGDKMNKGRLLVKKFKQLIEEKYQDNLSVKDYAEHLAVTPNHLSETVKQLTGRTSTDLINEKLLVEIKRLLIYSELTVSEIAFQLNFSDQSYFSKYFRKLTGQSPAEFRNFADKK